MKRQRQKRGRRQKQRQRPGKCAFCEGGTEPLYREPKVLKTYLTGRGKIAGREKTGVCAKHQRKLAREIKRSRHLALMPFVRGV